MSILYCSECSPPLNVLFNQLTFVYVSSLLFGIAYICLYNVYAASQSKSHRNRVDVSIFAVSTLWCVCVRLFMFAFLGCVDTYLLRRSNHYIIIKYIEPYVVMRRTQNRSNRMKKLLTKNIMCQTHLMQKQNLKNDIIEFGNQPVNENEHGALNCTRKNEKKKNHVIRIGLGHGITCYRFIYKMKSVDVP